MPYSSGFLNKRVTILNKVAPEQAGFGDTTRYEPENVRPWASVTWTKGVKAMREGALDAYDTVLIRMRWNPAIRRDSRIEYDGVTYQIQSFHRDYQQNEIIITATEIIN